MSDEDNEDSSNQDDMADDWAAAMEQQANEESAQQEEGQDAVDSVDFEDFGDSGQGGGVEGNPDLDVILDIPVSIAMEVGSTSITIRNLLQLNQGSVVELDRLAGEPLDVLVNGTLIAHGEVVVVNEKFGIRMTDVISPSERIKKLR